MRYKHSWFLCVCSNSNAIRRTSMLTFKRIQFPLISNVWEQHVVCVAFGLLNSISFARFQFVVFVFFPSFSWRCGTVVDSNEERRPFCYDAVGIAVNHRYQSICLLIMRKFVQWIRWNLICFAIESMNAGMHDKIVIRDWKLFLIILRYTAPSHCTIFCRYVRVYGCCIGIHELSFAAYNINGFHSIWVVAAFPGASTFHLETANSANIHFLQSPISRKSRPVTVPNTHSLLNLN